MPESPMQQQQSNFPAPPAPVLKEEPKQEVKEEVKEEPKEEEEMPKFEARWEELPENVVNRVLSFLVAAEGSSVPSLVRAAQVSKAWHEATKDGKTIKVRVKDEESGKTVEKERKRPSLWTHLDLSAGRLREKYRNDKKLEGFLRRFDHEAIKEVRLTGWKNSVSASTLKMLAAVCPNLVSLGLAACFKLSNEDLKFVGDNFKKLERLDLSNVSVSQCEIMNDFPNVSLFVFLALCSPLRAAPAAPCPAPACPTSSPWPGRGSHS